MDYSVSKLAKLANTSERTLRYYDALGLLSPARQAGNGYRVYGEREVDTLQQILFYRELGVPLDAIKTILSSPVFDAQTALSGHLRALREKRRRLDLLIANVEKTIKAQKVETNMGNEEKFEGFMDRLVEENEQKYGAETRRAYGDSAIDGANRKLKKMGKQEYEGLEKLTDELNKTLKQAHLTGDPAGALAQKACALHKKWLGYYWEGYSREAHRGLAQMYTQDRRFTAYYDRIAPGCAAFLRDAVNIFTAGKEADETTDV